MFSAIKIFAEKALVRPMLFGVRPVGVAVECDQTESKVPQQFWKTFSHYKRGVCALGLLSALMLFLYWCVLF